MAPKGKKSSLKAALTSQQSRLKKKQEAAHAAQLAEQKEKGKQGAHSKGKGKGKAPAPRPTIPFKPTDKILLVGEGNFSFAQSLILSPPPSIQYLPPENVTATAYDSEVECFAKYPGAEAIVTELRRKGVQVTFKVDATNLQGCAPLRNRKFDRIVWNFPHAGKGITDQDRNILSNQLLLLGFLRSAASFLTRGPIPSVFPTRKKTNGTGSDDDDEEKEAESAELGIVDTTTRGTILVTLRNVPPYTLWDLPKLAKSPPPPSSPNEHPNPRYLQLRSFVFHRSLWKGYTHSMTKGERAHGQGTTGVGGEDRTWEFCLKDQSI